MKYILMMHAGRTANGDYGVAKWAPQDLQDHIKYMHDLNRELHTGGELVGAEGLAPPNEARIVRALNDGSPNVSDGPLAETKEFLASYWLVDVDSAERAVSGSTKSSPTRSS